MADEKNKIEDFGEKIGGARKDYYAVDDIDTMTETERAKNITKAKVFPKPDYQKMYDTGEYTKEALYFQSKVYKALPTAPKHDVFLSEAKRNEESEQSAILKSQKAYTEMMNMFKELMKDVKDYATMVAFSQTVLKARQDEPEKFKPLQAYLDSNYRTQRPFNKIYKELVRSQSDISFLRSHMKKDAFLYSEDEEKLSKMNIVQVKADTISREFTVKVNVTGELAYNGSPDKESVDKAILSARTGAFYFPKVQKVEDGKIYLSGECRVNLNAKNEQEAMAKATEIVQKDYIEGERFGDIANAAQNGQEFENFNNRKNCVVLRNGGSRYYLYDQPKDYADPANYKEGTFLVTPDYSSGLGSGIIAMNIATREEAEKLAIEYVSKIREAQKAVSDARRKGKLPPPQLTHIRRVGEDYRDGIDTGESEYLKDGLSFRGVEFGNWENQNDRQTNLNMAYESFKDMTKVLNISEKDASLNGKLALAFGARGHGSALAHFEPDRNVINLTRMNGAGALGHELGHALDFAIARSEERTITGTGKNTRGLYETDFALRSRDSILHGVMNAMMYKPEGGRTKFYEDAIWTDQNYATADKGYWHSEVEMFARAFHVYLKDKLTENSIRNDYLCGLAEYSPIRDDKTGEFHYTHPVGEERKRINAEFDKLVDVLKEKGFFHEKEPDKEHKLVKSEDGISQGEATQEDVQLAFTVEATEETKEEALLVSVEGMNVKLEGLGEVDLSKNGIDITFKGSKEDELHRIIVTHDRDNDTIHVSLGGLPTNKETQFEYKANNAADNERLAKQLSDLIKENDNGNVEMNTPEYVIDTMHIVYVRGEAENVEALKHFTENNPQFGALWSMSNDCFEISEGDYSKYLRSLQSPAVQKDTELIQAISRVEQQLDTPFPEPQIEFYQSPKQMFQTPTERSSEDGVYKVETTVTYEIGKGTNGETVSVNINASASGKDDQTINLSSQELAAKIEAPWGSELYPLDKIPEDSIVKCKDEAKEFALSRFDIMYQEIIAQQEKAEAQQKESEGEKPMAENEKAQRQPFNVSPALKSLEETLAAHEPYAVMTISTSGLAKDETGELMRAVVQEYGYDNDLKQYVRGNTFDEKVAVSPEALNAAYDGELKYRESEGKEGYPYFTRAGIDYNEYMRGENVRSKDEFTKDFSFFMESMKQGKEDMLLVCTSGTELTQTMLNKVSPEAELPLSEKVKNRTVVSEVRLAKEFFQKTGTTDIEKHQSPTLENVVLASMKPSNDSFIHDVEKMRDFKKLGKDEFLQSYNYLTEKEYDATAKDMQRVEAALTGTEKRGEAMNNFITHYGREQKLLESEYTAHWREADVASREQMSEKGKEKYSNADFESKLRILVDNKRTALDPDFVMDRDSDADVNRLLNVLEKHGTSGESINKGFTVLLVATTGFEGKGENRTCGAPIQMTAIPYNISDKGEIEPANKRTAIINYSIQASERFIVNAENNPNFDAFKDAGINKNEYKAGFTMTSKGDKQKLHSRDEAVAKLVEYFKTYPPTDYPIISNGKGINKELVFGQDALRQFGDVVVNVPALKDEKNNVDFTRAAMEYSYMAYHKEGIENPMFDEEELKTFSLKDMFEAKKDNANIPSLEGTFNKACATVMFINDINEQALELYRPEILQQREAEKAQREAEKAEKLEKTISDYEKRTGETVERPSEVKFEEPQGSYIPDLSDIVDDISDIKSVPVSELADNREHGNLYSDKKNDKREIFVAEGEVRKVGEVEIPHVSEAFKENETAQKPAEKQPEEKPEEKKEEIKRPLHRIADKNRERSENGENRTTRRILRPDRTEKPAEPRTPSSAPTKAADNDRYLSIIEKQNELITALTEQNKQLMEQNSSLAAKVLSSMENQNRMLDYVLQCLNPDRVQEASKDTVKETPAPAPAKPLNEMSGDEKIAYIETVKETVAELKNSVPLGSKASVSLSNANANLSTAQRHIERSEQEKKNPPILKAN